MPHYGKKCNPDRKSNYEIKCELILYNFKDFIEKNKNEIRELYLDEMYSIKELSDHYNIKPNKIAEILSILNIKQRTLDEANANKRRNEKIKKTNLEKYGTENVLSKGSPVYDKRNQTVKIKYGVDNVRQHQSVKNKINNTMLNKYGKLRITDIDKQKETKKKWTIEYKKEISDKIKLIKSNYSDDRKNEILRKRFDTIEKTGGWFEINKLESRIAEIFIKNDIQY